jgi:hypothetical protein
MIMQVEINDFDELMEHSWNDAYDKLQKIDKYGLQNELMEYLEEVFYGSTPTDVEVNDHLLYEFNAENFIAEYKTIDSIEDLDELEELAIDLHFTEARATIIDFKTADKEEILWNYIRNSCGHYSLKEVFEDIESLDEIEDE